MTKSNTGFCQANILKHNAAIFVSADNIGPCFTAAFKCNLSRFFFIKLFNLRWPPLFVQTAFVQKAVSKMGKRNEWKSYTVNRVMHSRKYSDQRHWIEKKLVSLQSEWFGWCEKTDQMCLCAHYKSSKCDAIRGTGSAWLLLNCGSKLMRFFLPSQNSPHFRSHAVM